MKIFRKIALPTCTLFFCCLYMATPITVMAQVVSPETNEPYSVTLEKSTYKTHIDEPFFIHLTLSPQVIPQGYSLSTLVDLLEHPPGAKPVIIPGFPKIQVKMTQPGYYRIAIRVSLITKSSCAGVEAEEISEKLVNIEVTEK